MTRLVLVALFVPTLAVAEFPMKEVKYVCDTAVFYYTTSQIDCVSEQQEWYNEVKSFNLSNRQYNNALWYGQRRNAHGDIIGIDFKKVLNRARYLNKKD